MVGCLRESSHLCGNGGVCPAGQQCADTGDTRICILVTCGNGIVEEHEACDDGNNRSGDGCPADCSPPCGDGVLDPGEVCDDGNTTDGDGCSGDCRSLDGIFLVSPDRVDFAATEGDLVPAAATVAIRLRYRGDMLVKGYPPGVQQAGWLSITDGNSTANTAEFLLAVRDTSVVGDQSTMVRFTASHMTSTGVDFYDLPVTYSVAASDLVIHAEPAALSFAALGDGPAPPSRSATVAFNGPSVTVVPPLPSWLTVSQPPDPSTSPAAFDIAVNTTSFAPGTMLSGDIVFATLRDNLRRITTVHVDYRVVAASDLQVQFAAPYIGIAGRAGTLHIRGHSFAALGGPITLGIGDLRIGPVLPDNDTLVTVSYPALPAGRYPIRITDPPTIESTGVELVVVAPPAFTYQAIPAPGRRSRLVYDAERLAIYAVNPTDQDIEHFVYGNGTWSAHAPHVIPALTDIALAPNGRSLIALRRDSVNEISLLDGQFTPVPHTGNPDPFCGGFFDKLAPADNGKFFVVFNLTDCSGITPSYQYDMLSFRLQEITELYNGTVGASGDGSRIYACTNGLFPPEAVQIFDSLSGTSSTSDVELNLDAITVSGDASRVILEDTLVYDRSLMLTGNLPPHGVALASRDSTRAFLYVEDAAGARLEIYDLDGPLLPGALYPLLTTVMLADSANGSGSGHPPVVMASSPDDAVVFISGDARLLVVPLTP